MTPSSEMRVDSISLRIVILRSLLVTSGDLQEEDEWLAPEPDTR